VELALVLCVEFHWAVRYLCAFEDLSRYFSIDLELWVDEGFQDCCCFLALACWVVSLGLLYGESGAYVLDSEAGNGLCSGFFMVSVVDFYSVLGVMLFVDGNKIWLENGGEMRYSRVQPWALKLYLYTGTTNKSLDQQNRGFSRSVLKLNIGSCSMLVNEV
jgi:hypothetical protein